MSIERWALITCVCLVTAACGKKGPPLAPIVHVPDAVRQVAARRVGDDIFLTITLPTQNVDRSTPIDLERVDVYGYTGPSSPPVTRFVEVAKLVGTIEPATETIAAMTVRDSLTSDERVAGPSLARGRGPGPALANPGAPDARAPLKRFYMAIAFGDRGRAGPPSTIVELPLTPVPDAPLDLQATYGADAATLSWSPSGGLVGFLLDLAPPPTASPLDDGAITAEPGLLPVGPTRYNVYRETEPTTGPVSDSRVAAPLGLPQPVNSSPVAGFTYSEPLQLDGRRRCYTVSAVRGTAERAAEGSPSAPACITPVDTFPPVPPKGLSPIAGEGAISLVWEANAEPDLRGYVVWRREEGDGGLVRVTEQPLVETRFTDETVRSGARYVYAVSAVDTALAPNMSEQSEQVEVTAR